MAASKEQYALEVTVGWKERIVQVDLVIPSRRCRPYVIGEVVGASFALDAQAMGGTGSWTLVAPDATVHVPPFAAGAEPGPRRLALGESLRIEMGDVSFEVRAFARPVRLALPVSFDAEAFAWAAAGVIVVSLLAVVLYFTPLGDALGTLLGAPRPPAPRAGAARAGPRCEAGPRIAFPVAAGLGSATSFGVGAVPSEGSGIGGAGLGDEPGSALVSLFGYPVCMDPAAARASLGGTASLPVEDGPIICNLSKEPIRRVVEAHMDEVRDCQQVLGGEGDLVVRFVIVEDGSVASAEVTSTTVDGTVTGACIAGAVSTWRFGPQTSCPMVVVSYPFHLPLD
jgi:hypothetical protein